MSDTTTLADALTRVDRAQSELAAIRAANEGLGDYTGSLDEPDAELAELDALHTLTDAARKLAGKTYVTGGLTGTVAAASGHPLAGALAMVDKTRAELERINGLGADDDTSERDAYTGALEALADAARELTAYPPGTPMVMNSRESYPAVVLTPPSAVAGHRVLAWAEARRGDGEYPGGVVLCVSSPERAGGPEYVTWNACTKNGGRTWHADAGTYTGKYESAWDSFTRRARRRPATEH